VSHDGNRPVKVVRVGGTETRDLAARLRPDGGVVRMRVDHPADRVERAIERQMRRQIRRRPALSFQDATVEVHRDEIAFRHRFVGHAARLYDDDPAFSVDAARVAEGERRESPPRQLDVRLQYLLPDHRHAMLARAYARATTCDMTSR